MLIARDTGSVQGAETSEKVGEDGVVAHIRRFVVHTHPSYTLKRTTVRVSLTVDRTMYAGRFAANKGHYSDC